MSRLFTPATIIDSPVKSQPLLDAVNKQLGVVPNLFRLVGSNPAALEGYLNLAGALNKGTLPLPTRERIALAIAEFNACDYCLSAHTYMAKNFAKLNDAEITANRSGGSSDPKAEAALVFALKVAANRGHVNDDDIQTVKAAGYDDVQIIEIIAHVAINILTNYINSVADTVIDFPIVRARASA